MKTFPFSLHLVYSEAEKELQNRQNFTFYAKSDCSVLNNSLDFYR